MAKKATYSASRIGSFESCKLKYHLTYKEGYYVEDTITALNTRKGNAFHQFAEECGYPLSFKDKFPNITDGTIEYWDEAKIERFQKHLEHKFSLPEEFKMKAAVEVFYEFMETYVFPSLNNGWILHREIRLDFDANSHKFMGKLDLMLENKDTGEYYIIDYKTSKNANLSYHSDQFLLYAWGISQTYNVPVTDDLPSKIKIAAFFPFAILNGNATSASGFKQLKYNVGDLLKNVEYFSGVVEEIESGKWKPEPSLNFLCSYCGFKGNPEFCKLSYDSGLNPTRGTVISQRSWAKKAKGSLF
jgi:hypothetical protein